MTASGMVAVAMFVELAFEAGVDLTALSVEKEHGIDLECAWAMWRRNPYAFWGAHSMVCINAMTIALWAFSNTPVPIFCTSSDPCSCTGGGFEIYGPICGANTSAADANVSHVMYMAEYKPVFEFLGENAVFVIITFGILILVTFVFGAATIINWMTARFEKEKTKLSTEMSVVTKKKEKIEEENKRIRSELEAMRLNASQRKLVNDTMGTLSELRAYELDWKDIAFQHLLGSGSFGDCYKGKWKGKAVAIKRMRVGLVNEAGMKAFVREVKILALVRHPNLVVFVGFSMSLQLLIVMEFVPGGSLEDLLRSLDPIYRETGKTSKADSRRSSIRTSTSQRSRRKMRSNNAGDSLFSSAQSSLNITDKIDPETWSVQDILHILTQIAAGMWYLHSNDPPILHRDLKVGACVKQEQCPNT